MQSRPTITQILNAFQPNREIADVERFAGRRDQVQSAYYALLSEGTNIAVLGNRGVGKSSLARQILKIATGQNDLLEKLGIQHDGKLDYLTCYFACGGAIKGHQDVLNRLLTNKECLSDWVYYLPESTKQVSALNPKLSIGSELIGVAASLGGKKETEFESKSTISGHSLDTIFLNVVREILDKKVARSGILVVIDEFDTIEDPSGFAYFLKGIATNAPGVKFCIVGVAQDIQNLMKEHESSDRLFSSGIISAPPMSREELVEIIEIAERSIDDYIHFDDTARERMIILAQGHPYMIHLLGKHALQHANEISKLEIGVKDIDYTLQAIAARGLDPVLENRYKAAIKASSQREIVLKSMAAAQGSDGEVYTANAYKTAIESGIDNASHYVGQLTSEEHGGELVKVRDRYYRFKDSLFHAYVCARPSQYAGDIQ